jgi:hypothetical protein
MSLYKSALCIFVVWAASAPFAVQAQNFGAAENLYNEGVQAYFSGRSSQTDSYFSQLIAVTPNDPRPYYFRSLARLRQGRQSEARADMQAGANVEARLPNRYAVGRSLERVQGPGRLLLEQYRASARAIAATIPTPRPVAGPESGVVRERRIVPLEEFLSSGAPRSLPATEPEPTDTTPPATGAATPAETKAAAPATDNNPFGDDMASETAPKAPPAKAPPAKAAAPAPAEPKAAPKTPPPPKESPNTDENPFG